MTRANKNLTNSLHPVPKVDAQHTVTFQEALNEKVIGVTGDYYVR